MIEVNNLTRRKIDEEFLKGVAKKVLRSENRVLDISIALVGKKEIKELNKKYRKEDKATDVLSFGSGLNEIIICPEIAGDNLVEALIHGILHILKYSHGRKMFKKQKKYIDIYG